MKKIGVVIPACNEEAYIERCLLALKSAQTYFFQYFKIIENLFTFNNLIELFNNDCFPIQKSVHSLNSHQARHLQN